MALENFFHRHKHLFTFSTAVLICSLVFSFSPKQKKFDLYDLRNTHFNWSLDTKKIVFSYIHNKNLDIYSMNSNLSNQKRLTTHPTDDKLPVWSFDGEKIVFYSNRDGNNEIYVMDKDGDNKKRLTNHLKNDICPTWITKDLIMFVSDRSGKYELYLMDSDGKNKRPKQKQGLHKKWFPNAYDNLFPPKEDRSV